MSKLPPTFVKGFHNEDQIKKIKFSKFGATCMVVSNISFGCAGFSPLYGNYSTEECKATLHEALKHGINYIDTAPWYGQGESEKNLGECLKGIPRSAYYVATKVGRYEKDPKRMFDFSAKKIKAGFEESLQKLGLDYVDVINVHDIEFAPSLDVVLNEALPALAEIVKQGKAKYIGVTGYPVSTLAECIEKSKVKIDVVLSYCRFSLLDNTLKQFLPFFQSKNLGIINASCLCMGLLSNDGPQPWHPADPEIKKICLEAVEYCKAHGNIELGRLATFFCFNENGPHTHLIGINNRSILKQNLDVVINGISPQEIEVLKFLKDNIFSKLKKGHWEGVEIEQYKKALVEAN